MNKIIKRAIVRAALTNFELACIAGVTVIIADMTWLTHDIIHNGFSAAYGFIGTMMLVGLVSTIAVIVRHNIDHVGRSTHHELKSELRNCKRKAKRNKGSTK